MRRSFSAQWPSWKKLEIEDVFLKISQSAPVGNNVDQVDKYGPFLYMGYLNKEGKAHFKGPSG